MKTFDKKDVFSWSNAEEAKQYIGQRGYMADSNIGLQETININRVYELKDIDENKLFCFYRSQCDYGRGLFLPVDKVKEVEEPKTVKWRAFKSIDEFKKETGLDLLSIVHYRFSPSSNPRIITSTGYGVITDLTTCSNFITSSDKPYYVTIGDTSFNLDELFNYEYCADNEWKPFGVAEE